jgi:hypothetical protein
MVNFHVCRLSSPTRRVSVKGKIYLFEILTSGGAAFVTSTGKERRQVPTLAWEAISWWAQQGERIDEDGLCMWDYPPKDILKHLGGRHYLLVGQEPPVRGS